MKKSFNQIAGPDSQKGGWLLSGVIFLILGFAVLSVYQFLSDDFIVSSLLMFSSVSWAVTGFFIANDFIYDRIHNKPTYNELDAAIKKLN